MIFSIDHSEILREENIKSQIVAFCSEQIIQIIYSCVNEEQNYVVLPFIDAGGFFWTIYKIL